MLLLRGVWAMVNFLNNKQKSLHYPCHDNTMTGVQFFQLLEQQTRIAFD